MDEKDRAREGNRHQKRQVIQGGIRRQKEKRETECQQKKRAVTNELSTSWILKTKHALRAGGLITRHLAADKVYLAFLCSQKA